MAKTKPGQRVSDVEEAERVRRQHGEYFNDMDDRRDDDRLREIIGRLKDEDSRQNHRIREVEDAVAVMRADIQGLWSSHNRIEVALIGHDGKNGIRGTMMDHYKTSTEWLKELDSTITQQSADLGEVVKQLSKLEATLQTIAKVFGVISAIIGTVGIIVGIIVAL